METIALNGREFEILRLLGKGKGGYSYLVTDGAEQYVLKQIHHEPCDYYQFGDKVASELRDYETLARTGIPLPKLLDVDREQERILKEYIPGDTIDRYVMEDRMEDGFYWQMEDMCRALYPAGLNIDYFPTNFVVCQGKVWYIDYECNNYMEQWDFAHWGAQYWRKTQAFLDYFCK